MKSRISKGTVLVVDDEQLNVLIIAIRLRSLGYTVLEAGDGLEALALLEDNEVDLILSDVMMPRMDGFELVRRVKADPRHEGVPVMLITALDSTTARVTGLDAGADDFLSKPVNAVELELRVRSQIRLRHLSRELVHRGEILGEVAMEQSDQERIVVVEDDPHWAAVLQRSLRSESYAVELAGDLRTGLAAVNRTQPDVIVLDLTLPDGSGMELVRALSAVPSVDGAHRPIVVVVTGTDELTEKLDCLRHGADDYLVKPIEPQELRARISTQGRRARASRKALAQAASAREAAFRDALTGLYNRRFLMADLQRRTTQGSPRRFSVALLDLDHFKGINDTWGHGAGDDVLRAVSLALRANIRESDLACRYGGEEMVLVFPSTPWATRSSRSIACVRRLRRWSVPRCRPAA